MKDFPEAIGVYMKLETLEHKIGMLTLGVRQPYYTLNHSNDLSLEELNEEQNISLPEKLFVASDIKWQGYFLVRVGYSNDLDLLLWVPLKAGQKKKRKPFQGYTKIVPDCPNHGKYQI